MPTLCLFGNYNHNARNSALIKGLLENGIKVVEIRDEIPALLANFSFQNIFRVVKRIINLSVFLLKAEYEIILVPYPGLFAIFLARFLSSKPIIYDPFISFYLSEGDEYKKFNLNSLIGYLIYFLEYLSFKRPDLLLFDTHHHAMFFNKFYHIKKPYHRLLVGLDPSFLKPLNLKEKEKNHSFIVTYIGSYIPLHGLETIFQNILYFKDLNLNIKFKIIGGTSKQQKPYKMFCKKHNLEKMVFFIDPMPLDELNIHIQNSDLLLGVFGKTFKAKLVIPNKVYISIAAGKPTISADTPAINELFHDGEDIILCNVAKPYMLAEKILLLYNNNQLREKIARNGKVLYENNCNPYKLGYALKKIMEELLELNK